MKAEYFPPKEDVILQNEEPTDMYILITGAMDLISYRNGMDQVVVELIRRLAVCGEVFFVVSVNFLIFESKEHSILHFSTISLKQM
ncbi:hypothetical protein RDI58_010432 [Solanum bulbocastanum]|uniref:Cyclic nucleotide-binding domain-containing protein n=1 Tax=Solanum bulbocastanum TaxID=147425 RepID=A0AAN8YGS1_SOLBU